MASYHFVGIGGAGMAPLAELLLARGEKVSGSDLEWNEKCALLQDRGAVIRVGHSAENLPPDAETVIFTSAASPENPELLRAAELGIRSVRRGNFLAEFASRYRRVAAVSGSHGKSSISALLASILEHCGMNPGYLVGARLTERPNCANGSGDDLFVTEADESDGTHTLLACELGIVPNVEDDHAWSLGGRAVLEANFRTFAARSRHLIYYASEECDKLFADHPAATRLTEKPTEFAGLHGFQAENAFLAAQAAILLGAPRDAAYAAAGNYPQVLRRMTVHCRTPQLTVIEDYAHHPTEVRRSIELLRSNYPGAHLRVFFQPHRFARLERYFDDFAAELRKADSCFIAPVFAAWSETGKVDGAALARAAGGSYCSGSWEEDAALLLSGLPQKSVIAVFGAGDVEKVLPELVRRVSARGEA